MFKTFTIWAGLLLLLGPEVYAQNIRQKKVLNTKTDTLVIDTLSIVPGTVTLRFADSTLVDPLTYQIDAAQAKLIWISRPEQWPVEISYSVFPVLFSKKYSKRSRNEINEQAMDNTSFREREKPEQNNSLFQFEGLQKSGSISRSVGVGNNQDLALNSNMTLQLAGKVSNDLEILAAISDDNIPIQPEGNTQQINDFDKVFIQLKRKNAVLTGGDLELRRPDSYFMNFFKRTQGGAFSTSFSGKSGWQYKSSVSAAVAKGRSSRLLFNGTEGNQGPYRLTGSNGEQNIIVLSGTERVFIDAELLTRGQENDYVINYNTSEITFTAKRLITRNSRITIEFEYSDKNYARTLSYLNQEVRNRKLGFRFNYYNEQDNPDQPFLQDLSPDQKQFLQSLGNSINQAYYPNIDTVAFNENEILYKQTDTLGATGVFVFSTNPSEAKYRPNFSYVGAGKGNYRLSTSATANGRVFEFVLPSGGLRQGDYEPVALLVTPKKQQLVTLATDYKAGKNTFLSSEIAFSNNDLNLFSTLGNKQNQGLAFRLSGKNELLLNGRDTTAARIITAVNYENTSSGFKALERYRSVEFERDFNLSGLPSAQAEHLGNVSVGLYKDLSKNISYQFSTFIRENIYTGFRNKLEGSYQLRDFNLLYSGSVLSSSSLLDKGNFLRQRADLSRNFRSFILGLNFEQEHNKNTLIQGELNTSSFSFDQYKAYLNSAGSDGNTFRIEYSKRYDRLPFENRLTRFSVADIVKGELGFTKNPNSILTLSASYRNIQFRDTSANENENTLLGRMDYNLSLLKGFINSTIFYEMGPGREPKREFSYLEVSTGQGAYTWNDYNKNGLKELNEFEIARYQDQARYIRVYQNTNQFINSDFITLNYTLRLNPALLGRNKTGFYKFLSLFSSQTAYKTERKTTGKKGFAAYNPFSEIIDANLISDNTFFRNTLFFNRNNPVYGIDFNYQVSGNKLFLINGFDTRNRNEGSLRFRWNIRKTSIILESRQGIKEYASELFTEKNYRINFWELAPEMNYLFNTNFRISLNGTYRHQNNLLNNMEQALNYRMGTELRYNILNKGTINSSLNLVKNKFNGDTGSSLAYEMLEGLQPGNNMIWNAGLQKTIAQGIQLNIGYEGRKSAEVRTVHRGSVQFRAFF